MSESRRPLVIALTGGIASGKTAVSDRFAARGIPVVDTDRIAREVVAPGTTGLAEVAAAFGKGILDAEGRLDRSALRKRIFGDAEDRERLEAILHPQIERAARAAVDAADGPYVILVVPLLVETGLFDDADRVLVVDVPESIQVERLMARDGVTAEQARDALAAQASRTRRLAVADDVIENVGVEDALDAEVQRLDQAYRDLRNADPAHSTAR